MPDGRRRLCEPQAAPPPTPASPESHPMLWQPPLPESHLRLEASEIARRSRGTPRLANNRLRWIRDYSTSRTEGRLDVEIARAALAMQGIDAIGLDGFDRKYLETIQRVFAGGPVGIEAIAHTMSSAPDTLEDDVEPFLLRCELVIRTPRGRKLTPKGDEHIGGTPAGRGRLF